ncbi:MAG: hypothetical protein A3F17_02825 [Gammaproteobacteria bacterium RIFCSPHIGHO2_12_FULL_41_15]|nr:MAG: hypothetical protein A3F17_02825 [Gammaproteobacteria bacterium RIFCSPHIGHO2_12_FULL_41_15]
MSKSMTRAILIVVAVLVLIIGIIAFHTIYNIITMTKKFAHMAPPAPAVTVAKVESKAWQPSLSAVGTLQAVNGVNVSPEVPGTVTKILFQSGKIVSADQPLVQLDDSTDQQNLRSALAQLQLKTVSYEQQTELLTEHATSKIALDQAKAALESAKADVANAQHAISEKLVRAPFAGKIGIRKINLGEYVTPGQAIVSLQSMNPLYLQFFLPEQDLSVVQVGQSVTATVDTYKGEQFVGRITAINAEVDDQTRNIEVQATIPNKDLRLYPGIFANVSVQLKQHQRVMVIPETAVSYSLYGDAVYVVNQQPVTSAPTAKSSAGTEVATVAKTKPATVTEATTDVKANPDLTYRVTEQFISVGLRQGSEVSILKGLKVGDWVVTSGQQKLHNNDVIRINNKVQV